MQCLDHFHVTVSSLELIKERPHFELIDGRFFQLRDDHSVLLWRPYLQDTPLTLRLAMVGGRSVQNLITLDVQGRLLDLRDIKR